MKQFLKITHFFTCIKIVQFIQYFASPFSCFVFVAVVCIDTEQVLLFCFFLIRFPFSSYQCWLLWRLFLDCVYSLKIEIVYLCNRKKRKGTFILIFLQKRIRVQLRLSNEMYWDASRDLITFLLQIFRVNMLRFHEDNMSLSLYLLEILHTFKKLNLHRLLYIIPSYISKIKTLYIMSELHGKLIFFHSLITLSVSGLL
jgi:hypothetical protein